jgi:hypothetical protein
MWLNARQTSPRGKTANGPIMESRSDGLAFLLSPNLASPNRVTPYGKIQKKVAPGKVDLPGAVAG